MGELENVVVEGRVKVLWSVGVRDVGLVQNIVDEFPSLKSVLKVFLTGDEKALDKKEMKRVKETLQKVQDLGVNIQRRRLLRGDLEQADKEVNEWYLCTAPAMRKQVQERLPGKSIIFENFDY